jgi:small-conductance mechanosensitive channel
MRFTCRIGFEDPELTVRLVDINDASFGLRSRIWTEDPGQSDFPGIRGGLIRAVTDRFETARITVPYPRRTVDGTIEGGTGVATDRPERGRGRPIGVGCRGVQ